MMIIKHIFSFLKNVLIFLIDRLYKEWEYMLGRGEINYSEEASERGDLFVKKLIESKINGRAGKYYPYELGGKFIISYRTASIVFGKARLTCLNSLHRINTSYLTEEGKRLFINTSLGTGPSTYQRPVVFRLGKFTRKTAYLVSLVDIKFSADFSVEKETGRNGFLLNFAINELNGFKPRVNGFGYFDWAINVFLSFWTLILKRIFRNLLEKELEQYISNRLPNYQFPVEATSYQEETKVKSQDERVQNNEETMSLSESFDTKQSHEMPKWAISPIGKKSSCDGHNSKKYGDEKDMELISEITNTSSYFPETNKWISERKSFDLPLQSIDLFSETSNKISRNEISQDKVADKCDPISELSIKTRELTRSFEMMEKKLDLLRNITNSLSKETPLQKCLEILDKDDKENTNSASSSPAKELDNEELFLLSKRIKVKSELDDLSRMLQDSYRDQLEIASEVVNKNLGQSKLLEEIFSEIQEQSNTKDVDATAFNMGIKWPANVANCDSSVSTELETFQIHENILKPSSTETGIFINIPPDFDSRKRKAQINHLENMFNGKKRKQRTKDSNKNCVSVERFNHCQSLEGNLSAPNPDLKMCSTEMFQSKSLISCTIGEFEEHLKILDSVLPRKAECQIEDSESVKSYHTENLSRNRGVKSPENQCISNPENEVDLNLFMSNIVSDSMQQKTHENQNTFDLEKDTEMVSTGLKLNEKHFKCVEVHKEELKEGSQLKEDEGCSMVDSNNSKGSSNSSQLHSTVAHFHPFPIPVRHDPLTLEERGRRRHHLSGNFGKTLEKCALSKMGGKSDSTNYATNSRSEYSLVEELECLNERGAECPDSVAEVPNATGFLLDEDLNKSRLEEATDLKTLHDLQEEITAEIRKILPAVALASDPEGNAHSSSVPISSDKNLEHIQNNICNELNQFQQKDSKTDLGVSLLEDVPTLLSEKEDSTLKYETLSEFAYTSESDSETSGDNEPQIE